WLIDGPPARKRCDSTAANTLARAYRRSLELARLDRPWASCRASSPPRSADKFAANLASGIRSPRRPPRLGRTSHRRRIAVAAARRRRRDGRRPTSDRRSRSPLAFAPRRSNAAPLQDGHAEDTFAG